MLRRLVILCLTLLFCLSAPLVAQKICKKGKPCGNTCIAMDKQCHVGSPSAPAPTTAPAPVPLTSTGEADASAPWVASPQGHTYYKNVSSCKGGQQLKSKIYFKDEKSAEAAGYARSSQKTC